MLNGSYKFSVGDFQCIALSDGSLDYPTQNLFANVSSAELTPILQSRDLPLDQITTPYTFLYVDTGSTRMLADMGAGTLAPTTGKLPANLRAAGIEPAQVDVVVITHAHPDHVGGALDEHAEPVFANARYFIWQSEWDFWFSDQAAAITPDSFADVARSKLAPLQSRMNFLHDEYEFLPGINAIHAPGHTPGHIAVSVSSAGEQVLYISDTVLSPLHLEYPQWHPVFDVAPDDAQRSKQRIFDLAAREQLLVMGMHFPPFPSLGTIAKLDNGWQWQPIAL